MKIDFIVRDPIDRISGGNVYDRRLLEHLREQGDEVDVLTMPRRGGSPWTFLRRRRAFLERVFAAPRDVLLQDELAHAPLASINERLGRRPDCSPIISIVHHLLSSESRPAWRRILGRGAERRYLRSVDGFVFNSHMTRRSVTGLLRRPRPFVVAHPGRDERAPRITPDAVRRKLEAPGPLKIVFLGNVIPRKGLHVLLEALSRLQPEQWELEVIGDLAGDRRYARAMQRLAARADAAGRIRFLGLAAGDAVKERLRAGHVLAVPSSHEGFGIAYLEAMALGLPVIASSSGGAQELVRDLRDGFLVDAGDAGGLAARLRLLAREPERLLEMSLSALKRAAEFPSWYECVSKVRSFLLEQVRASKLGPVARGLASSLWWQPGPGSAHPDAGGPERSVSI